MANKKEIARKLDGLVLIEGVEAIPPHQVMPKDRGGASKEPAAVTALPARDVEAFRSGGWTFGGGSDRGAGHSRPMFRDSDGHVKIDSGGLTVRFAEGVSEADIADVLKRHGLTTRRKLGFASNLLTVQPVPGRAAAHSVDIAKTLSKSEKVEYAEPILIEPVGKR